VPSSKRLVEEPIVDVGEIVQYSFEGECQLSAGKNRGDGYGARMRVIECGPD
jgi:hypothetical protein